MGAQTGERLKPLPASLPGGANLPVGNVGPVDPTPLTISEFVFSEASPDFQIEAEVDPIDAAAEEAAMLYANGQDTAVQQVLENTIHAHRSGPGERLWLLLFDFFRLTGKHEAFEALSLEYAQCFEKSPPIWRENAPPAPVRAKAAATVLLKGDLVSGNNDGFAALREAIEKNSRLRLDLSKVRSLDSEGCERLLALLLQAHKNRREVELLGLDGLEALVDERVVLGCAQDRGCWLLKLELCQLRGQLEAFEDLAINYAVTFEISPPSWEPGRIVETPQVSPSLTADDTLSGESYVLKGDVRNCRFSDLLVFAAANDPVLLDCADVTRMDFLSAGALLNALTAVKHSGRQIVFRHPHRLLAELFRVVGLKAMAEIVFVKN